MPECPIRIEGPLPQPGGGQLWRITPLGFVAANDCTCKILLDGREVTGTGPYGNFYVDAYGAGMHVMINPPPSTDGTLRFEVDCPNCSSRINVPIRAAAQTSTAEKIIQKVVIVLVGPSVFVIGLVVMGVVTFLSLPAIIFIGLKAWWDAVKKAWGKFFKLFADLWDFLTN